MNKPKNKENKYILGQRVDYTTYRLAVEEIIGYSKNQISSYICASNVHMIMESYDDINFQKIVNGADLITADGMPLVWALKLLGIKKAERVYGPNLMIELLKVCASRNINVGLYGGEKEVLDKLVKKLPIVYKGLVISYAFSPPFRKLNNNESKKVISKINNSKCKILFVGLGCPKQETWMSNNTHFLNMPLIGVGASFDFLVNSKRQAPIFIQNSGLEWLFRLFTEPKRLFYRYFYHNPRFIYYVFKQLVNDKNNYN